MASLFQEVARFHGVPVPSVSGALGRNRTHIDVAVYLPFAVAYGCAALAAVRKIWNHYAPSENGWTPGVVMTLVVSWLVAAGVMLLGEVWVGIVEGIRIGTEHISYRAGRLWPNHYRVEVFSGALIVFWLAATMVAFRVGPPETSPRD